MKLETLSKYDDLLSDILVDSLFLWFQTHKMNPNRRSTRVKIEDVVNIVQDNIVSKRSIDSAIQRLLSLDYIKIFLRKKNPEDTKGFIDHSRRYLSIYHPEAGFEISQTHRYRTSKTEASVIATKRWEIGEEIRCCSGGVAILTEKELQNLEKKKMDFSVMWSSRKNSYCLFLGPARFVNHDCNSNCEFEPFGPDGICLKVVRSIEIGEEITTYYGGNYFGTKNCECQCATCERVSEGAFKPTIESILEESEHERSHRRSIRKRSCKVGYTDDLTTKSKSKLKAEHRHDGQRTKYEMIYELLKNKDYSFDNAQDVGVLGLTKLSQLISLDSTKAITASSDLLDQITKLVNIKTSNGRGKNQANILMKDNSHGDHNFGLSHILNTIKSCTIVCSVCQEIWVDDTLFSGDSMVMNMKGAEDEDICRRCERHEKIFGIKWPERTIKTPLLDESKSTLEIANTKDKSFANECTSNMPTHDTSKKLNTITTVSDTRIKRCRTAKSPSKEDEGLPNKRTNRLQGSAKAKPNVLNSSTATHEEIEVMSIVALGPRISEDQDLAVICETNSSSQSYELPTNSASDTSELHTPRDIVSVDSPKVYENLSNAISRFEFNQEERIDSVHPTKHSTLSSNSSVLGLESPAPLTTQVKGDLFGSPVLNFSKTIAVFVNPLDDEEPFWWPALLVPSSETDGSMRKPKPGQHTVRYFEDGTYSLCWPKEFVVFDPTTEPFTRFKSTFPNFLDHVAVRRAIAYYETGQVLNEIKWLRWQHNENKPVSQRRHEDVAIIKTYMCIVGDEIQVTNLENPVKSWKAVVKEVELLRNEKHKGLHYYVHYPRASSKQDEWISPSQIAHYYHRRAL